MCALNLQPDRTDQRSLQTNFRAVERHLDDDHYTRFLAPGHFTTDATPGVDSTLRWSVISFPDGANTQASATFYKPSEWRTGRLEYTAWFTSDGSSTANFRIVCLSDALRVGEVSFGTNLFIVVTEVAGPAAAGTVLQYGPLFSTTSLLGSDDQLISFYFARSGLHANDLNPNLLQFMGARVRHVPAEAVSQ